MRLHHHPASANARRVVMTAIHLDLPLELIANDLESEHERARLAGLNPNVMVPVLEDGDFVLWESCAIMQYLAEHTPNQQLYPRALQARADVNRWMFWAAQHFGPAIYTLTWQNVWKEMTGNGGPDAHEVARGEAELMKFAAVLDTHLAQREWISGASLTLADLAVAAPLMYRAPARLDIDGFANMLSWFERVQQLNAWKRTEFKW
jgi:glutathione S-transferase